MGDDHASDDVDSMSDFLPQRYAETHDQDVMPGQYQYALNEMYMPLLNSSFDRHFARDISIPVPETLLGPTLEDFETSSKPAPGSLPQSSSTFSPSMLLTTLGDSSANLDSSLGTNIKQDSCLVAEPRPRRDDIDLSELKETLVTEITTNLSAQIAQLLSKREPQNDSSSQNGSEVVDSGVANARSSSEITLFEVKHARDLVVEELKSVGRKLHEEKVSVARLTEELKNFRAQTLQISEGDHIGTFGRVRELEHALENSIDAQSSMEIVVAEVMTSREAAVDELLSMGKKWTEEKAANKQLQEELDAVRSAPIVPYVIRDEKDRMLDELRRELETVRTSTHIIDEARRTALGENVSLGTRFMEQKASVVALKKELADLGASEAVLRKRSLRHDDRITRSLDGQIKELERMLAGSKEEITSLTISTREVNAARKAAVDDFLLVSRKLEDETSLTQILKDAASAKDVTNRKRIDDLTKQKKSAEQALTRFREDIELQRKTDDFNYQAALAELEKKRIASEKTTNKLERSLAAWKSSCQKKDDTLSAREMEWEIEKGGLENEVADLSKQIKRLSRSAGSTRQSLHNYNGSAFTTR